MDMMDEIKMEAMEAIRAQGDTPTSARILDMRLTSNTTAKACVHVLAGESSSYQVMVAVNVQYSQPVAVED